MKILKPRLVIVMSALLIVGGVLLWKMEPDQRCLLLHTENDYSIETWEHIQFHLPSCWEFKENEDGDLMVYNNFNSGNESMGVLYLSLESDLSQYEVNRVVTANNKEYREYISKEYLNVIYEPIWIEKKIYIIPLFNRYDAYPAFTIVFGSIEEISKEEISSTETEETRLTEEPMELSSEENSITEEPTEPILEETIEEPIKTEEVIFEEEAFVIVDSPKEGAVFDPSMEPIVFKGRVSEDAQKIVVTANFTKVDIENDTETPMQDVYTLTSFKAGDTDFIYRAKAEWNNLGLGENHYTFTAFFEDGSSSSFEISIKFQFEAF